ncbi:MAG: DUF4148 domain-containing protein [Ramlibacter sp.]|nr:DUF4148 domain-containing protein [Ramlibacter sp.]
MNASKFLAVAALSTLAAFGSVAQADEADASQFAVQFNGTRTRAEVQAEAAVVARTHGTEPAGSRVAAPLNSSVDRATVRAQAAEAVRLGQISYGEASVL